MSAAAYNSFGTNGRGSRDSVTSMVGGPFPSKSIGSLAPGDLDSLGGDSGVGGGGGSLNPLACGYQYRKWCGIRRSTWLLMIYIFTYVGFLVFGSYAMAVLEGKNEARLRSNVRRAKSNFLARHRSVNGE